jgi:hypothetical protein
MSRLRCETKVLGATTCGAWESLSAKGTPWGGVQGEVVVSCSNGPTIRVHQAQDPAAGAGVKRDRPGIEPPPTSVPLATKKGRIRSGEQGLVSCRGRSAA